MPRIFKIDGTQVLAGPGWVVTDQINARKTLSFSIADPLTLPGISSGDTVELLNDTDELYAGIVSEFDTFEPAGGLLEYSISAVDNSALADRRRIGKVYENVLAGDIAKDLITEKLGEESVTQGVIQDGPIIKKAVFPYWTCSQALDYLREISGFIWYIDMDRKLNFFDRATFTAPWALTTSTQHSSFRLTSKMDGYRNTQLTRGGKTQTIEQPDELPTPAPDGSSRTFVTRFPLAKEPTIETNTNGAGWVAIASADIGINGLDQNKKWYWGYDSPTITQSDTETVLRSDEGGTRTADQLRITYIGLRNLLVIFEDQVEIAARKAAEPLSSGVYEDLAVQKNINEKAQAIQYTQGLLETYGQIKDYVTFNTEKAGLQAGQMLRVTKPLYGIDDDFLIESVVSRPIGMSIMYSVKALDGAAVGGWDEFFKQLAKTQKDFTIGDDEVVLTIQSFSERVGVTGEYQLSKTVFEYPSDIIYPSDTLYGSISIPGGSIYD